MYKLVKLPPISDSKDQCCCVVSVVVVVVVIVAVVVVVVVVVMIRSDNIIAKFNFLGCR